MSKNKIAILTQPLGKNYGGIIQNYALQKVLKNKGFSVETIARQKESKIREVLSYFKNETYNTVLKKRIKKFSKSEFNSVIEFNLDFINKYITISNKICSTKKLSSYFEDNNFDHVIIGSDQTWRPMYSPNIYNYYLDFLYNKTDINKIAYASSFGTHEWEYSHKQTTICKRLIKQFSNVSLREESGVNLCSKYFGVEGELVLDPTLLLDPEDYIELFKTNSPKNNGLYNYVLDKNFEKENFIKSIADHLNIKIYNCQPKVDLFAKDNDYKISDYKFPSPESWLQGFYDADFVITDSFHGTVFSILFNKPFIAISNESRGASRFKSLLKQFNLEDRLVTSIKDFDLSLLDKVIDYDKINLKRKKLVNDSLNFLFSSLNFKK